MAGFDFDRKQIEETVDRIVERTMRMDLTWDWPCGVAYYGISKAYEVTKNEKYLSIRTFSDSEKLQAYTKQNGICKICGKHFELEGMEADHITPWSQGGKTNLENCQMLCRECNRRKSDK